MDLKKLRKYVNFARKEGLSTLKVSPDGTVEFTVGQKPQSEYKKIKAQKSEDAIENMASSNDPMAIMPSDSDLLFWSSPAFDVITETRKEEEPRNGN